MTAVTVVIPLRNGAPFIREALEAVWAQRYEPLDVIVVDDGSTDGGAEIVREVGATHGVRLLQGGGRGAAAALNLGFRVARGDIVCQIDQDVVLQPGWMTSLLAHFDEANVAAAQGIYTTDRRARLLARVMNRDLEDRYAAIDGDTDHVCTGNAAYRADAIRRIGGFDEMLGYGYDNDVSYRLRAAGYRLVICPEARSVHRWREDLSGYFLQQYGFGYGRLDLVAKHPARMGGDAVSPPLMMLHPIALLSALAAIAAALVSGALQRAGAVAAAFIVGALLMERAAAGVRAARRFRDWTPLWFPVVHTVRDLAWVSAILVWTARRALGVAAAPSHSMKQRPADDADGAAPSHVPPARAGGRSLIVIPAFNEAGNLPKVVAELRSTIPGAEILVVDDGSTDDTVDAIAALNVRWIRLPERMGIGGAMRAGLRYAARQGFTLVGRLDGDGQHRPEDVGRLIALVSSGRADIAFGRRSVPRGGIADGRTRLIKQPLAACLSALAGRRVLDPTCGLSAMGSRAIRLLAEHHPTGYPEAELRLLISRTTLTAIEVDIDGRPRLSGRTSLTPIRLLRAAARVALAMCVVPLRRHEAEAAGD